MDSAGLTSHFGSRHHLSEVRIVLLGSKYAGKSSAGNTILGREEFDLKRTAQCVKRHGEVAGRKVTVVEAPGWWSKYLTEQTPEMTKQEIVSSLSLVPPGPHTLLLVVRVDTSFTKTKRRSVEEHLELLSKSVWNLTIVLFTWGDWLGDTTIEQHIESEGEDLQWLVEKCGNRYHVLNNKNKSDGTQVKDLLEKIEEMVAGNSGAHLEMNREVLQQMEEKKKSEDRAKERKKKVSEQRDEIRLKMSSRHHLSEVRIVLLGYKYAGKSSAGNTILGREEFDLRRTAQCVKRHGEVAGRKVIVVEALGWWWNYLSEETPELTKQEIVSSLSLVPPGPHTLLLVVRVDTSFTETNRRSVKEHLELLSKSVWSHTIVLFTWGDWLGDTTIEQHIESEGEDLQYLVEKCGNRYHVLNNKNKSDGTQVKDLLEKIEEMVAGNSGAHLEMNREVLQKMEEKKKSEDRAKKRKKKVSEQRDKIRLMMSSRHHLSEVRIVLLGYKYAGKSSAGNTILGREKFDLRRTAQCVKRHGEVARRKVTVVEAPGWWRNYLSEETPELTKQEIVSSLSLVPPGPHTLLLVVRVDTSFTETNRRSVKEHLELLSKSVWSHTIVLFTWGDWLGDTTIEQHIESEGEDLQWLVEKCGNRYHVLNNKNKTDGTQVKDLLEKIEEMVEGSKAQLFQLKEMDNKNLDFKDTDSMHGSRPNMSGDDISGYWSLNSSAYSSFRSEVAFDSSSDQLRSRSSTSSSGVSSLGSITASVGHSGSRRSLLPNFLKFKKHHKKPGKKGTEEKSKL
uniref:AIG1-type G domain-containing protein n=1 Tax=Denticeps clupeoides TaxID=299321 RepID=A0AAY4AR66_9TELE